MPITVKAVSKSEFEHWVEQAKEEFASIGETDERVRLVEAADADRAIPDQTAVVKD